MSNLQALLVYDHEPLESSVGSWDDEILRRQRLMSVSVVAFAPLVFRSGLPSVGSRAFVKFLFCFTSLAEGL